MITKKMIHISLILIHGDPVHKSPRGTVHSEAHSLMALTHWSQLLHLASNVIPPVAHRGLFLHALLGFSYEILGVRALSRMTSGEATKTFEGEDTDVIFSLYFSLKQSQRGGLEETWLGLWFPCINNHPPKLSVDDCAWQFQNQKPK